MTEHQLQYQCVSWYNQTFPENHGLLFATFQETISQKQGGQMKSLGLMRGVSDLILLDPKRQLLIELKAPNSRHPSAHVIEQAEWIINTEIEGYFIWDFEAFKKVILAKSRTLVRLDTPIGCAMPFDIIETCRKAKTISF